MKMFTMDESTLPKIDDFDKDSNLELDLNLTMMAGRAGDNLQRECPCAFFEDNIINI